MINSIKTDSFEMDYLSFWRWEENFVIIPWLSIQSVLLNENWIHSAFSQFENCFKVHIFDRIKEVPNGYSIQKMADDTYQAMTKLWMDSCNIFWASQWWMIAQCIAIKHPDFVKKMVLWSTSCKINKKASAIIENWIKLAKLNTISELIENFLNDVYSEETIKNYWETIKQQLYKSTESEIDKFKKLATSIIDFDIEKDLWNIKSKTLVIWSNNDKIFWKDATELLSHKLNCEKYLYDGYSHAVYDEAPDYRNRILDALKD